MFLATELNNIWFGLLLTLVAGLSTGIGGLFLFFYKKTNEAVITFVLGFSAGIMIYVSFVEIFPEALHSLAEAGHPEKLAMLLTLVGFFGGMLLIFLIDKLVPHDLNPHETKNIGDVMETDRALEKELQAEARRKKMYKTGILTLVAITIHNFPEGIATFIAAATDPELGIAIALAIALHNIPEGIAVAIPVYEATKNRKKAFLMALLSGLAEPIGALVALAILLPILTPTVFGIIFSSVAGIMVFISFDELLPASHEYGKHHISILGVVMGMAIMAVSLLIL